MKIRNGFVSNSSTSSFICDVCGEDITGHDISRSDAEMYICVNGHEFCEKHIIECTAVVKGYRDAPVECCPVCQLKEMSDKEYVKYLEYKLNTTYKDILKEVGEKFKNYEELKACIWPKSS